MALFFCACVGGRVRGKSAVPPTRCRARDGARSRMKRDEAGLGLRERDAAGPAVRQPTLVPRRAQRRPVSRCRCGCRRGSRRLPGRAARGRRGAGAAHRRESSVAGDPKHSTLFASEARFRAMEDSPSRRRLAGEAKANRRPGEDAGAPKADSCDPDLCPYGLKGAPSVLSRGRASPKCGGSTGPRRRIPLRGRAAGRRSPSVRHRRPCRPRARPRCRRACRGAAT